MEQFSIEKYLKNPNRQIVTRDGRIVRILCTDRMGRWPIVALIRTGKAELLGAYRKNGRKFMPKAEVSLDDLFFVPKKKVYPFKVGDRVLVRDSDTSWDFDYFDSYREESRYPYMCRYAPHEQCIPLNEHTWKLLGTTDEYKKEE